MSPTAREWHRKMAEHKAKRAQYGEPEHVEIIEFLDGETVADCLLRIRRIVAGTEPRNRP